ncbi:hypothetical protein [Actinokineospora cianjurensis]|uniref:Uncharacterized protein n=1 Tax=Actinokineospora cianjurensis TaxID=585224 RepID=A0A421BC80_9PSEU|nr:hypothetical protein [Actinokineospora cianjurensis]RLK61930.1 hypothetical protein CLV68_2475 [Actinokineospora cianjurensis]
MTFDLPGNYKLDVEPIAGVEAELVEIGYQYWSFSGVDQYGQPTWELSVKSIDTRGRGQANVIAIAAISVVVSGAQCPECEGPLRLRSRSGLSSVLSGELVSCVNCDPKLTQRAAALLSPESDESRRLRQERQEEKERARLLQERYQVGSDMWRQHQRQVIEADFGQNQRKGELSTGEVDAELATLTLLRYAAQFDPMPPLGRWHHNFPFHADVATVGPMINNARNAGLLLPDSSTSPNAFVWNPATYDQAWANSGGDLEKLELPMRTTQYYPTETVFRIPFGPSPDKGREMLDAHLCERLTPANMTAQRQEDLLCMIHCVLAAEALRWFTHELKRHNLPAVPENHAPRLIEAVEQLVAEYSLGYAYFVGWKSVKTAAAAAQATPRAPIVNMTTHGVNVFEREVQQALDNPVSTPREFDESQYLPLCALTKTLFYTVLRRNPMQTSLAVARAAMPMPAPTDYIDEPEPLGPAAGVPGFRRGTTCWIEFAGNSASQVLLRAADYLEELEKESRLMVLSTQWDLFPVMHDMTYGLRIELDGISIEDLPTERRPNTLLVDSSELNSATGNSGDKEGGSSKAQDGNLEEPRK